MSFQWPDLNQPVKGLSSGFAIPGMLSSRSVARLPTDPLFYCDVLVKGATPDSAYVIFDATHTVSQGALASSEHTVTSAPSYANPMPVELVSRKYGYDSGESSFELVANGVTTFVAMPANTFVSLPDASGVVGVSAVFPDITITGLLSKSDVYDYLQYWQALSANLKTAEPLTTQDGINYTSGEGWALTIDGGNISGGFSYSGDVLLTTITNLTDFTINGTLTFSTAGTYTLTGCVIDEIINTSGGAITINAVGNTSITTNTGPNITINNAVSVETIVLDDASGLPIQNAHVHLVRADNHNTILSAATDALGVASVAYNYLSDVDVIGWVRQHDLTGVDYTPKDISGTITNSGFSTTIRLRGI